MTVPELLPIFQKKPNTSCEPSERPTIKLIYWVSLFGAGIISTPCVRIWVAALCNNEKGEKAGLTSIYLTHFYLISKPGKISFPKYIGFLPEK